MVCVASISKRRARPRWSVIALVPLSLPVFKGDRAIRMIEAHDQMLLLLPNRAPDRHIIKATVQQPGHRLVLFEPT